LCVAWAFGQGSDASACDPAGVLRVWTIAAVAALALSACGSREITAPPPPLRTDDAFVVRMARHQQTGLALAQSAATDAHAKSVRRLARQMVSSRERTLPALMARLAKVPTRSGLPDLGVSPAQAAEGIRPDALKGAQPLDAAFLTLMAKHDQGALALAQAELGKGTDPATKALAQRVAADAAGELNQLDAALVRLARQQTA
jgi:uncharacterized protein (DUF305 family)